jgi:hypothetical protein
MIRMDRAHPAVAAAHTPSAPGSEARAGLLRSAGFFAANGRQARVIGQLQAIAHGRASFLSTEDAEDIASRAARALLYSSTFVAPPGGPAAEFEAFVGYARAALESAYAEYRRRMCSRAASLQARQAHRLKAWEERKRQVGEGADGSDSHARARVSRGGDPPQPDDAPQPASRRAEIRWRDMDALLGLLEASCHSHPSDPDRCIELMSAAREAEKLLAPLSPRDRAIIMAAVEGDLDLLPFPSQAARRKAAERAKTRMIEYARERGLLPADYQAPRSLRRAA